MPIYIEVNPGELVDRITILEIKAEHIKNVQDHVLICTQLAMLNRVFERNVQASQELETLKVELRRTNELLWVAENKIRSLESQQSYESDFIETARIIYMNNDRRHTIKRRINELLSFTPEVKSYEQY